MTPEQQAAIRDAVAESIFAYDFWGNSTPKWSALPEIARRPFHNRADAAITTHLKALEAVGLCVAPMEPTEAMIEAIDTPQRRLPLVTDEVWDLYRAMIAVRPR